MSLLSGRYRITKHAVTEMLREVFEVEMSTGAVCNSERVVSEAIEDTATEARTYVQSQLVVHVDETSWREARKRAWLWVRAALRRCQSLQVRRWSAAEYSEPQARCLRPTRGSGRNQQRQIAHGRLVLTRRVKGRRGRQLGVGPCSRARTQDHPRSVDVTLGPFS